MSFGQRVRERRKQLGMSQAELVQQGMAFNIAGFVITPWMGLVITLLIGAMFFALCVVKFNKADFSTIKLARDLALGQAPLSGTADIVATGRNLSPAAPGDPKGVSGRGGVGPYDRQHSALWT